MNTKYASALRVVALIMAILLMLPMLFACKKEQELVEGTPSVTVDAEERKITYAVKLSAADQQAHLNQTAYLYELLPGETVGDLNGKSAMLQNKVSSKIRFVFALDGENGLDRRCNRYVMVFSDGSVYGSPVALSNPELLAVNTEPFPGANSIKGMNAYGNGDLESALHASHTLISLSMTELMSGETDVMWNGESLSLNQSLLEQTDKQVADRLERGMQISLELILSPNDLTVHSVAVINLLLARYEGTVTGFILRESQATLTEDATYSTVVKKMASVLHAAHIAMVSRAQNGRVYLGIHGQLEQTKAYGSAVLKELESMQSTSVGLALSPDSVTASVLKKGTETTETAASEGQNEEADRAFLLSDLVDTAIYFREEFGRGLRLSVVGLDISAADSELQSALYAYAYRVAHNIKADFLIYQTPVGEKTGLYDADGLPRPVSTCFALADTSENLVAETLAAERLGKEWEDLKAVRASRVKLEELAYVNASGAPGKRYLEFSEEGYPSFTAVGQADAPAVVRSESSNSNVLMASISPSELGVASGFRCQLPKSKKLQDTQLLSANLLLQSTVAEEALVTLRLEGTGTDGRAVSLETALLVDCNEWQTVSFYVRSFTMLMDPDAPCSMILTMEPRVDGETSETGHNALWLHSVHLRGASFDYSGILLIGVIVGGFLIGFSVILLTVFRKKRRHTNR